MRSTTMSAAEFSQFDELSSYLANNRDVLGEGEICHIADYAAAHFEKHKRPLRIAVDEACWRFNNVTAKQIEKIRRGEPAANPNEKNILWAVLRLLRLNIQLIFVWDGLRKPGKTRHRGGGRVDAELVKTLHQLFDRLQVPYHRAPGEAEAECARLEQLGIVDAVWSDDCDSFMFGCQTLIKQHKVKNERKPDYIRIYKAATIRETLDLNADSLVLFALLAGGDYQTSGLPGCGPQKAKVIATIKAGLATSLRKTSKETLQDRKKLFVAKVAGEGWHLNIPQSFPEWKALEGYRNPAVSTVEQACNLRRLRDGWDLPINHTQLRTELRQRYNFQTREYLKHITPVILAKALSRCHTGEDLAANLRFEIALKHTRKQKIADESDTRVPPLTKILYSPANCLPDIDVRSMPANEDWSTLEKKGQKYDPLQKIECEILTCFLRNGLPADVLQDAMPVQGKKPRTKIVSKQGLSSSATSKQAATQLSARSSVSLSVEIPITPSKRKAGDEITPLTRPTFRRVQIPERVVRTEIAAPLIVDLCEDVGDDTDYNIPAPAVSISKEPHTLGVLPDTTPFVPRGAGDTNSQRADTLDIRPGHAIPGQLLRERRAAATYSQTSPSRELTHVVRSEQAALPPRAVLEVIDLT